MTFNINTDNGDNLQYGFLEMQRKRNFRKKSCETDTLKV